MPLTNATNNNPKKDENPIDKGEYDGSCNRSACLKPHARYYNHSTQKYYCATCAHMINDMNRADAMRLYGHELCVYKFPDTDVKK